MSVAEQLGLDDEDGGLLGQARDLWPGWVADAPDLGLVSGPVDLRLWLRTAESADADRVLHGLARLGSPWGGDCVPAAGVLAWVLVPGACALARRLRMLTPRVDEVVAAQLWVEVRTFSWERLRKVAANILDNTRTGVLRECGAVSQLQRSDRTWSHTVVADPHSPTWEGAPGRLRRAGSGMSVLWRPAPDTSPADELWELLEWACAAQVITAEDRSLLVSLVEAADRVDTRRLSRGCGGLMANDVSELVAGGWGISPATVRRRARRSVAALSAACAGDRYAA